MILRASNWRKGWDRQLKKMAPTRKTGTVGKKKMGCSEKCANYRTTVWNESLMPFTKQL